jgi:hypothetical protein
MTTWKDTVRLATTQNISSLGSPGAIDGVTPGTGDRILVKDQSTASQNGIYSVVAGALVRASDTLEPEAVVRVSEGTVNAHTEWVLTNQGTITIGTTALSYAQVFPVTTVASIAELMSTFGTFESGSIAEVAGFSTPGDGGGGTFIFDTTKITGATRSQVTINTASMASPIVIDTGATAHGFVEGQWVHITGVIGNDGAHGGWRIFAVTPWTFKLAGSSGSGSGAGGTASSVTVTTSAKHRLVGRAIIERVVGISINGTWPVGVLTDTMFSIASNTGGTYSSGGSVGDGGISIPSSAVDGRWLRRREDEVFNPKWFGAKIDRQTDDINALEAMQQAMRETGGIVAWPEGLAWISRTWTVTKPLKIFGKGGNEARHSGVFVAPGRTAIELQSVALSAGTSLNGASYAEIHRFNVESHVLIHPETSRGIIAGFKGLNVMNATNALVRNGDVYVKPNGASETRCFRAATPTAAAVDKNVGGFSMPSWSDTLGSTVTDDDGIVWTTEGIPGVRVNNTCYLVGDRVFAKNDNRYLFRCTVAGKSANPPGETLPQEFNGGDYGILAVNAVVGGTVTDRGVTWIVELASGVYCNATGVVIDRLYGYKLTGYLLHAQAGMGADARGSGDANNIRIARIYGHTCGGVLALLGSDCNAWTVNGVDGIYCGLYHPSATTFVQNSGTLPYPDGGRGGHILVDRSDGGGAVMSLYGQLSSGKPIVKNGNGRSTFVSCGDEYGPRPFFSGGASFILGGLQTVDVDPASSNHIVIDSSYGQGISEVDRRSASHLHVALLAQDGLRVYLKNILNDSTSGGYGQTYDAAGHYWAEQWYTTDSANYPNHRRDAYRLSAPSPLGLDPGTGWLEFPDGCFVGVPSSAGTVFRGHIAALRSNYLRHGLRKAGDQFVDGGTTYTITSDGYRAVAWASGAVKIANAAVGFPASMVEPTTNTVTPLGGEKVFRCTTAGISQPLEPDWSRATNVGNTVTEAGGVVWTLVGFTPSYVATTFAPREDTTASTKQSGGSVPRTTVRSRRRQAYTSTASANQVIEDGASFEGQDFVLLDNAVTRVAILHLLKKSSTVSGGSIEVKADYVRNGGAPTLIGSATITYNLSGTSLDGTTGNLNINGNRIEYRVSPESADALSHSIIRTQTESVDVLDPASLTLSGWFRDYGGSPWNGTASQGGSSSGVMSWPTGSETPSVGTAVDGHGTMSADGVDDLLRDPTLTMSSYLSSSAYTVVMLVKPKGGATAAASTYDDQQLFYCGGDAFGIGWSTSGVRAWHYDGSTFAGTGWAACAANQWHIVVVTFGSGTLSVSVDLGPLRTASRGNATLLGGAGAVPRIAKANSIFTNMELLELMTATSALSAGTISEIRSYLRARYPSAGLP